MIRWCSLGSGVIVMVSVGWLILVSVTLRFLVATCFPCFGVVGLARLDGRSCLVVVVAFALAWVLPSDLWCVGSIMCVLHWCHMMSH